jgi:hypothetical protein
MVEVSEAIYKKKCISKYVPLWKNRVEQMDTNYLKVKLISSEICILLYCAG